MIETHRTDAPRTRPLPGPFLREGTPRDGLRLVSGRGVEPHEGPFGALVEELERLRAD